MSFPYVLPAVLALALLPSSAALAAVTAWDEVVVRVYDNTAESLADRRASLDVAAAILSAASVDVIWRVCDEQGEGQRAKGRGWCDFPIRDGELVLRIVTSAVPHNKSRRGLPLGDALIDVRAGAGLLATIYFDRVAWTAWQTGAERRVLLGRAIAHELGHLLLATNTHGTAGLMRAVWSWAELRQSRTADWTLGPVEIATIRARARSRW